MALIFLYGFLTNANSFQIKELVVTIISWLFPIATPGSSIPIITDALWYIPVYLIIVIIMPYMKKVFFSRYRYCGGAGLLILFVLLNLIPKNELALEVSFYAIWVYIGFGYSEYKEINRNSKKFKLLLVGTAVLGLFPIVVMQNHGFFLDMQTNKFPPNIMFCMYSIVAMSLIGIFTCTINIEKVVDKHSKIKSFLLLFSKHSLTIYLYQTFVFLFLTRTIGLIIYKSTLLGDCVKLLIFVLGSIVLCYLLCKISDTLSRFVKQFYQDHKEVVLYLIFGGFTFIISVVSFTILNVYLHLDALLSNIISWIIAILFSFITNKKWVFFTESDSKGSIIGQLISFIAARIFTLIIEEIILYIFIYTCGFSSLIVKLVAQIIVIGTNYILSKMYVFK